MFMGGQVMFMGGQVMFMGGQVMFMGGQVMFMGGQVMFMGGQVMFMGGLHTDVTNVTLGCILNLDRFTVVVVINLYGWFFQF